VICRHTNGTYGSVQVFSADSALIYCEQFVGSQYVGCLKTFIQPTTYCNHNFDNVYYMHVEKRFQDVQIQLLRLDGQPVSFADGDTPTKIVLHFRLVSTQ
jgi:hypothetical protein